MNDSQTLLPDFAPDQLTYAQLFEAQVDQSPDTIALVCGEEELSYQALDEHANRLARYLLSRGVQPDEPVGVCMTRSMNMVVAILGIIKAGGAYLPLDPAYPADRLSFILNDSGARIVLSQSALFGLFQDRGIEVVCLDVDEAETSRFPATRPDTAVNAENLAYVIYTSGSTGRPKGVMIPHASLVNFVTVAGSVLDVSPEDIYLQSASIAYALSVRQLMIPLATGATVVVALEETGDPLEFFKLIQRRKITLIDMVPSFWRSCLHRLSELPQAEQAALLDHSLRRIVSVGEALTADLPREWASRFGGQVQLVNIFGQTETTGVVATYPIPTDRQADSAVVPIGRSASHTRLYILDASLQPVPDGEVGELCVSNPCLARGYLNRPDLTGEKFVPNPFGDGFSERLYRTGDQARCRPDGVIEFLGRGDQQVKIRGQRIELGEVEATLREHRSVRDCVVTVTGAQPDDRYLAAYVVNATGSPSMQSELKEFLRKRLPEAMVPAVIVFLEALPLNPNGKVDRLALPDPKLPGTREQAPAGEFVPPRNQVEKTIAGIWQDVMKLDRVGIHDNFFDLGGHSLMAVRILTLIEGALQVRLPLTSFLHSATVAQLAELVNRKEDEVRNWSPLVPIQTNGSKRPFFGVHAVGGGILFWRNVVQYLPGDQPFYAIQSQGVDGVRPALHSIEDMARLYIGEIRKVQPHGPYSLGGFSLGGEIALEMAQQLTRQGETVDLLVMLDTKNPVRAIRPARMEGNAIIPILEPQAPASRYESLKRKAQGHLRIIRQLNGLRMVIYLGKLGRFHVTHALISASVKLFRLSGKRLPDFLLLQYLRTNHRLALRNYAPSLYPGKIIFFQSSESQQTDPIDAPMGWAPLAGDGLEVHYFDTPHEMIKPEYAEMIARKLNECMISAGIN